MAQESSLPAEISETTSDRYTTSPEDRSFNRGNPDNPSKESANKEGTSNKTVAQPEKAQKASPVVTENKAAKQKTEKQQKVAETEDDVLSFNFLYFLYKRFKYSDLADQ